MTLQVKMYFFLQLHDISHDPTPFLALGNKNCFRERIEFVQSAKDSSGNCSVVQQLKTMKTHPH
jgi:hypothetical protein